MAPVGAVKVLIANRGEIAVRVQRSCHALGLTGVAVYTDPDALSLHVLGADERVCLGESPREYTNAAKLVEAALAAGCKAVHPGYGFLSESVDFAERCQQAGLAFLGPSTDTLKLFARKHTAREFAEAADVPVLAGSPLLASEDDAVAHAEAVGYPILLKATGGGGGIGIYICRSQEEVRTNFASSVRQGQASFGDSGVFVEKFVERARHIEVQVFGDGSGRVVHLGERECSVQRRNQKILEETPSPYAESLAPPGFRQEITAAAVRLCAAAKYRSAGTVEFLLDEASGRFYFLEVNTRLQVEHGITELVTGVDIVEWMMRLQIPGLQPLDLEAFKWEPKGHAIEVRLNAEDPYRGFSPSSGVLGHVSWPKKDATGVRVDSWVETGTEVTPYFDSLLGKMMVHAPTRTEAIEKLQKALAAAELKGIPTNLEYLGVVAADPRFAAGETTTSFLNGVQFAPHGVEVLAPGLNTTVQDFPGRVKLWAVGVPPSGPMDSLSFRLGNALVDNPPDAAGLEITLTGPTLKFLAPAVIALIGAEFEAELDGEPVPMWRSVAVPAGATLAIAGLKGGTGSRAYLAVAGGIDVPVYLGSRATFPGGKLGGLQGRPLRAGDFVPLGIPAEGLKAGLAVPEPWVPKFAGALISEPWVVGVLPGPDTEPDYFTPEDIATLYSADYHVHYNSNRLGIRLEGPWPQFARPDGGEGGSHPSNVHDHIYAIGTINFTGNMPIVLMPDGPSLGGFVCPATILETQMWKMGQVRADDTVKFRRVTLEEAYVERMTTDKKMALLRSAALGELDPVSALAECQFEPPAMPPTTAVLHTIPASDGHPGAIYRLSGDRYIKIEYGPMELDLNLRVHVDALEKALAARKVPGLVETSPGVRSVMIEYDQTVLPLAQLLEVCKEEEAGIAGADAPVLDSRILHLPLAFNCRWSNGAITKYMKSVRSSAPYLPSNVDFVAANNGLEGGAAEVQRLVTEASYMVLGLGDVYLGAPCAVPVDPRHRLVVPKYNPARTFTEEGTVGLGGSYMCIYPMDSPGGYQLIGRTLPIWNTFGRTAPFSPDKPWLLRNFDQVRFFLVDEEELLRQRKAFRDGQLALRIEHTKFSLREYNDFVASIADEVAALKTRQRAAMAQQMELDVEIMKQIEAERADTAEQRKQRLASAASSGALGRPAGMAGDGFGEADEYERQAGDVEVTSSFTANVWEILVQPGDSVEKGQRLLVLEAMKMEYPVVAPAGGRVRLVRVSQGQVSQQGDVLIVLEPSSEE